jgi:hypothetical protein
MQNDQRMPSRSELLSRIGDLVAHAGVLAWPGPEANAFWFCFEELLDTVVPL